MEAQDSSRASAGRQPVKNCAHVDTSDFALNNAIFERLCRQWGFPTADVFAGQSQRFHKHKTVYTAYFTPDTSGVDAMLQD